jgi:hypothetical protein
MCLKGGEELKVVEGSPNHADAQPRDSGAAAVRESCGGMRIEEYVDRIAEEMHQRVEHQRSVFRQILGDRGNGAGPSAYCPLVDCARLSRLRAALQETIDVLEETRSSFKSKRLEVMRKKLIDILAGV